MALSFCWRILFRQIKGLEKASACIFFPRWPQFKGISIPSGIFGCSLLNSSKPSGLAGRGDVHLQRQTLGKLRQEDHLGPGVQDQPGQERKQKQNPLAQRLKWRRLGE